MHTSSRRLHWAVVLVGLAVLGATLACSFLSAAEPTVTPLPAATLAPTLPPLPTQPPVPTAGGGGGTAVITMINQSGEAICYVNISPVTDQYWGDDWLGSSETVGNGESRTFEVEPGGWDIRAMTCNQDTIDEERQITITASGYQWVVQARAQIPEGPATLRLVNNLSVDICYVRISPVTDQYWGDDWLGADIISAGDSHDFAVPPGQSYDLRAEDCSQNELAVEQGVAVTNTLTTWTISP
jgi:hypothetical protein